MGRKGGRPWEDSGVSRQLSSRLGMTLFEILLVLILLVIIASLAKPIFDGAFSSVRLRRGGDQVLAAWSELRSLAVQTGQTHQFQFQVESGHYRLEPWYGFQVEVPAEVLEAAPQYGEWKPYEADLPEDIKFIEGEQLRSELGDVRSIQSLVEGDSTDWSEPIIFFPDGSTTAATLLISNEKDLVQRLTLRALTGVGRASEVLTSAEARSQKGR